MNQYDTLYKYCIIHPYFDDGKCTAIRVHPEAETLRALANYRCIFRQMADNEWHIIGEIPATPGDWLHACHPIRLTATIQDPHFLWYTTSLLPTGIRGESLCCHSGKDSLKTFEIRLNPGEVATLTADHPKEYALSYHVPSLYWEYLLIPRNGQSEERSLLLSDATGEISFDAPVPTLWNGSKAYKTRSTSPIPLRAHYPFQLQLYEKKGFGPAGSDIVRRLLSKRVHFPMPGQFVPSALHSIQQILYF